MEVKRESKKTKKNVPGSNPETFWKGLKIDDVERRVFSKVCR
jgi:hypothetical protein